ncbi:DoxX-like family protein [Geodermatophilus amargosae]|uniref:DoxX-like family protein n=2 Tax=Geodermatophilus amargosae TaxID=1296565 RepID=A0A1I7BVY7_9ACTN|nr:DoxX-like family protein [Geodermatophilus amargosae]
MVEMFADVGAGQWLRILVGVCEVTGAVGVLVPRLAVAAASGLALLMVGATVTDLAVLQASPVPSAALLVLAVLVAWGRRTTTQRSWLSGPRTVQQKPGVPSQATSAGGTSSRSTLPSMRP